MLLWTLIARFNSVSWKMFYWILIFNTRSLSTFNSTHSNTFSSFICQFFFKINRRVWTALLCIQWTKLIVFTNFSFDLLISVLHYYYRMHFRLKWKWISGTKLWKQCINRICSHLNSKIQFRHGPPPPIPSKLFNPLCIRSNTSA